jgi:FixJ family two-component response regulator
MPASITVFVVDKDESVLRAMARLMKAVGFQAVCVSSIEDLLQKDLASSRVALLVDVRTARLFEASLHEQLLARGLTMPVIYLTDCDTDRQRRKLRNQGAAGYFRKPVDQQALVDAITFATQQPNGTEAGREARH